MYYFLLFIFLFSFTVSIITKKIYQFSEIIGILILLFITFMIGLRKEVGIDYSTYEFAFNFRYNKFVYEPLYSILMYVIKKTFDKFHYLTFVMSLITNIFIYLGLKKRKVEGSYLILAIYIYISNVGLIFMNLMRQGVAVAIFFYASTFITERNFKKYFAFIMIGAGFHFSMILLLPLYFFPRIRLTKLIYVIAVITCYFMVYIKITPKLLNFFAINIPMFSKYYNHEYLFNSQINLLSLGVILNIIFIFILLCTHRDFTKIDQETTFYLLGTLFNILSLASFMFDRIGIYFFINGIVSIPILIRNISNNKVKLVISILCVMVTSCFFIQTLFLNPESLNLKYESIYTLL